MFSVLLKNIFFILFCYFLSIIILQIKPDENFTPLRIELPEELDGPYSLNTYLNDAEHLYKGLMKGPASFTVINDELYSGVHGGQVIKIVGDQVENVVKFGLPCDGQWQEKICGRPFGLATSNDKENLLSADAYYGIWKYNIKNGIKQCLVSQNETIDGKGIKIFNSLIENTEGDIYWTHSSINVDIQDGFFDMFLDGSGRLIKYSREEQKNIVLMTDLNFPTGIALSPDEEFIVVAEMKTSRLLKYYLTGSKQGKSEVFLDRLPGFPDKLKVYGDFIIVPLVHSRDRAEPVLFQTLSEHAVYRRIIHRMMTATEGIFKLLHTIVPLQLFEKIVHKIGHFETVSIFAPKRVTILIANWQGHVIESWHNLDSSLEAIGAVEIFDGHVYFGSPYNEYIGRTSIPEKSILFGLSNIDN